MKVYLELGHKDPEKDLRGLINGILWDREVIHIFYEEMDENGDIKETSVVYQVKDIVGMKL